MSGPLRSRAPDWPEIYPPGIEGPLRAAPAAPCPVPSGAQVGNVGQARPGPPGLLAGGAGAGNRRFRAVWGYAWGYLGP